MKKIHVPIFFLLLCSSIIFVSFVTQNEVEEEPIDDKKVLDAFLNAFPKGALPYHVVMNDFERATSDEKNGLTKIPSKYAQYIPGIMSAQFSRMRPDSYRFEANLFENDTFALVVYSVVPSFANGDNKPSEFLLATYNKTKRKIDPFRRQMSEITIGRKGRYTTLCHIESDLSISVKTYKKVFKDEKQAYTLEEEPFETVAFQVSKKGVIKELGYQLDTKYKAKKQLDIDIN